MMEWLFSAAAAAVSLAVLLILLAKQGQTKNAEQDAARRLDALSRDTAALLTRQDVMQDALMRFLDSAFAKSGQWQSEQAVQNEQKLDNLRRTLSESLNRMQEQNADQLESIRKTVDEKLQDALDKKLSDSFRLVSERLEQVYKGLGEMQTIATGVGDLKRVLSNVKTRGVLGELQLGAILEQILTPEQYARNVATRPGSREHVEYVIKLPGVEDGKPVWLPIDAKCPTDAYTQLLEAYDAADPALVEAAQKTLRDRLRAFAKDINQKYICPPHTTDFALMFLPFEGLYAEAVRIGLIETLQSEFKVVIAGPTTTAALLNSLQMGFRTLAIQKRSGEVWKVLGAVKNEFDTFGSVLEQAQKRISQANDELDRLVGVRTRVIQSKLKDVQSMPEVSLIEE